MTVREKQNREEKSIQHRILTAAGIILCVILTPLLLINITLIVKSYTNTEEVPSLGGYLPMIVLTDSMYPGIQGGDLIICRTAQPEEIQKGDVISFFDPAGDGNSVVTHRVTEVTEEDGEIAYRTKGDANNTEDAKSVPAENLVGIYQFRIAGVGNVAMFMQTTPGLVVCVICPLVLIAGYDFIRRKRYEKQRQQESDALLAELKALKEQKAARESAAAKEE